MAILIMNETKEDCGRKDSKIFLCPYTGHFERCSDGCKVINISDATAEKIFLEKIEQGFAVMEKEKKMSRYINTGTFDDTVLRLNNQGWGITNIDYKRMDRILFEMPTADVRENVKGEWLDTCPDEPLDPRITCNKCGNTEVLFKANFCPNCGADMRGDKNE